MQFGGYGMRGGFGGMGGKSGAKGAKGQNLTPNIFSFCFYSVLVHLTETFFFLLLGYGYTAPDLLG